MVTAPALVLVPRAVLEGEIEEWRRVPTLDASYEVSNLGNVRRHGKPRKVSTDYKGYKKLSAQSSEGDRSYSTRSVHSMVCEAFIGPRPPGLQIDHINNDPGDNRPSNLRYVTGLENVRHMVSQRRHPRLEGHGRARLTEALVAEIRMSSETAKALAHKFGVDPATVRDARRGRTWSTLKAPPPWEYENLFWLLTDLANKARKVERESGEHAEFDVTNFMRRFSALILPPAGGGET